MIYKGYYTLSIDEYCQLEENPTAILFIKYPWPEKYLIKAINRLNRKMASKINKKEANNMMYDKTQITHIEVKINLYILMWKSFITQAFIEPNKDMLKLFEKHFKHEYSPENITEITDRIQKLKLLLKQLTDRFKQPASDNKESIIKHIIRIQNILGYPIGQEKLFKLKGYHENAMEIVAAKQKINNKQYA